MVTGREPRSEAWGATSSASDAETAKRAADLERFDRVTERVERVTYKGEHSGGTASQARTPSRVVTDYLRMLEQVDRKLSHYRSALRESERRSDAARKTLRKARYPV